MSRKSEAKIAAKRNGKKECHKGAKTKAKICQKREWPKRVWQKRSAKKSGKKEWQKGVHTPAKLASAHATLAV